jgi:two-component system sensor histidine kinase KdpD
LRFAREYRVGQVVIGRPHPVPWWRRLKGERSVAQELINRSQGVTVVVVDADSDGGAAEPAKPTATGTLSRLLSPQRIVIWEDAVSRSDIREQLVKAITTTTPGLDAKLVLRKLAEREEQGSTFLNEGVALPHARLENLESPQVALGLTHAGVLDAPTDRPVEVVFLLLSPATGANVHLQLLAKVGRALQSRDLRRALNMAKTSAEALAAVEDFESAASGRSMA